MPLFEYRCEDCGKISEFLVGVSQENPEMECAHCGGKDLQKVLSKSNFVSKSSTVDPAMTCCGRDERCAYPHCETDGFCPHP